MSDRTFANSETVQTVGRDTGSAALGGDWLAVVDVKLPEVGARRDGDDDEDDRAEQGLEKGG